MRNQWLVGKGYEINGGFWVRNPRVANAEVAAERSAAGIVNGGRGGRFPSNTILYMLSSQRRRG